MFVYCSVYSLSVFVNIAKFLCMLVTHVSCIYSQAHGLILLIRLFFKTCRTTDMIRFGAPCSDY
jgi:hypothetical protein